MLPVTLFYSWQMDRPSNVCRTFIGKTLDDAVTILADEGEIALKIGSDNIGEVIQDDHLRRAFDTLWMTAGFDDGSPLYVDGRWAGSDNGGRNG